MTNPNVKGVAYNNEHAPLNGMQPLKMLLVTPVFEKSK